MQPNRTPLYSRKSPCWPIWQVAGWLLAALLVGSVIALPVQAADTNQSADTKVSGDDFTPQYRTELIRGQVDWLAAILDEEFGISTVPEVSDNALAIFGDDGHVYPLVENLRGRAFRKDERLRGQEMEILVRRYQRQPLVQVLRIYQVEDEQRYEVDYWCDVCAIVMFETGPCACCQDKNRLRKRLATPETLPEQEDSGQNAADDQAANDQAADDQAADDSQSPSAATE